MHSPTLSFFAELAVVFWLVYVYHQSDVVNLLVQDSEFIQAVAIHKELEKTIASRLSTRETTLNKLKELKQDIEVSYSSHQKAKICGLALEVAGYGLGFSTSGASLVLTGVGGVLTVGAEIGYIVVSQWDIKLAQQALDSDREMMERAEKLYSKLAELTDSLKDKYPTLTQENIYTLIRHFTQSIVHSEYLEIDSLKDNYPTLSQENSYTLLWYFAQSIYEGLYSGYSVKIGVTDMWRTSTTKAATKSGIFSIVGAVFNVVYSAFDLVETIKDVHEYSTTGKSNSQAAKSIGDLIIKLEQHRDRLKELLDYATHAPES